MKAFASAIASSLVLAACGSGFAPGQGVGNDPRSGSAVSDLTRQQIINACSPPFTGVGGTGGLLSSAECGVPVPTSGADQDPQHWWFFAGCLVDHPSAFSNSCRSQFDATCGHNGDLCICDVGEVLQDDGSCTPTACLTITQACHDHGFDCGTVSDNCGGTYDCGACTAPETCGGGGTPNVCGPGLCVPETCGSLGFNCGTASDTCGGTLNCGACMAPATCGGAGVPNMCGVPAPLPSGDALRQGVIDACSPPGGQLSAENCGVPVPTSGTDQNPQHWWFFAGCLVDHPSLFSNACISNFDSKCGHNGDLCICDPGEVLQDDGSCL